jgi:cytochrome c5
VLVKKSVMSSVVKSVLFVSTVLFAGVNFADNSRQGLQGAAVSDGFNAEQKYMASCFACHSTGAAGAPKVGDGFAAEWTPRMEKGMDAVVTNAINGINTMPPKGLCFDCNDDDLRAIVQYMVESST